MGQTDGLVDRATDARGACALSTVLRPAVELASDDKSLVKSGQDIRPFTRTSSTTDETAPAAEYVHLSSGGTGIDWSSGIVLYALPRTTPAASVVGNLAPFLTSEFRLLGTYTGLEQTRMSLRK